MTPLPIQHGDHTHIGSIPPDCSFVHKSADGYPVEVGRKFWDNDLRVVQITELGTRSQAYADTGEFATWHKHTRGISDTLTGSMQRIGRLVRRYEGYDAENYEPGKSFLDVRAEGRDQILEDLTGTFAAWLSAMSDSELRRVSSYLTLSELDAKLRR